jgi:hypothetical protein
VKSKINRSNIKIEESNVPLDLSVRQNEISNGASQRSLVTAGSSVATIRASSDAEDASFVLSGELTGFMEAGLS